MTNFIKAFENNPSTPSDYTIAVELWPDLCQLQRSSLVSGVSGDT